MDFNALTLENINKGVAAELFEAELEKVVKNLDDPNVTKGKRSITLNFEFTLEGEETVKIYVSSKATLQSNKGNKSYGYFVLNHGKPVIVQDKFKQDELFQNQNVKSIENLRGADNA